MDCMQFQASSSEWYSTYAAAEACLAEQELLFHVTEICTQLHYVQSQPLTLCKASRERHQQGEYLFYFPVLAEVFGAFQHLHHITVIQSGQLHPWTAARAEHRTSERKPSAYSRILSAKVLKRAGIDTIRLRNHG